MDGDTSAELGILDHLDAFTAHSLGLEYDSLFQETPTAFPGYEEADTSDRDVFGHMNAHFGCLRHEMRALSGVLKRSFLQQAKNSHAAADLVRKVLSQAGLNPSMQELKDIVKVRHACAWWQLFPAHMAMHHTGRRAVGPVMQPQDFVPWRHKGLIHLRLMHATCYIYIETACSMCCACICMIHSFFNMQHAFDVLCTAPCIQPSLFCWTQLVSLW